MLDALHYAHNLKADDGRSLNIVHSDVSPSNIFVSELGEVTLVAELRDSETGQILARGVDRRVIGRQVGGTLYRATKVKARGDVKMLFDAWAELLRQRLDQIRELSSQREEPPITAGSRERD